MYLTFLTNPKNKQITIEDIIKNPYLSFEDIPDVPQKKVTVEITEEYGRELYNKRYKGTNLPDMAWADVLIPDDEYTHWKKRKKSGNGYRQLHGPSEVLKSAQRIYKTYIEDTLRVLPHKAAHAYTKGRSIVTNAEAHKRNQSKWGLKIDFSNFFDSIDEEWLRKMLLQVYPFKFIPEEHFNRIIKLALLEQRLPQGSVLSPTLTNIIMVPIDHTITTILHNYNKHHYVYTRYADDIAISCKEKFDKKEILSIVETVMKTWETPFEIKPEKTKMMSAGGRFYICGVNLSYDKKEDKTQLSAGHKKNDKFRAIINNFCVAGEEWELNEINKMLGLMSYYRSFEKDFVEKVIEKYNAKYNIDIMKKAKQLLNGVNYTQSLTASVNEEPIILDGCIPF